MIRDGYSLITLNIIIIMRKFIAVEALLALIIVFVTLWHGSEGAVEIIRPVRAQRSIYYYNGGERNFESFLVVVIFWCGRAGESEFDVTCLDLDEFFC